MSLRDSTAKAWAESLEGLVGGIRVYPHRRKGEAKPPFAVVSVPRMEDLNGEGEMFWAEMRIVLVSETAETPPGRHADLARALHEAIRAMPRYATDETNGVRMFGWMIDSVEQVKTSGPAGENVFADVIRMHCGVGEPMPG